MDVAVGQREAGQAFGSADREHLGDRPTGVVRHEVDPSEVQGVAELLDERGQPAQ